MSNMFKGELKDTKKGIKQESRGTLSSKSKPSLLFSLVSYYFDYFFTPHFAFWCNSLFNRENLNNTYFDKTINIYGKIIILCFYVNV